MTATFSAREPFTSSSTGRGRKTPMDARTPSAEDARELEVLRRRAYGPDADIADDPAAVKRLRELEDEHRAGAEVASTDAGDAEADGAGPGVAPSPVARDAVDADGSASQEPAPPTSPDPSEAVRAPGRRWWQRVPVWSVVAIALVVGIGVGAASMSASVPRADAVLHVAAPEGGRDADWQRELRTWGIAPDSAVAFEPFNGVGVWTASSDEGSRCLILEDGDRPVSATCVGGGFDPILDVTMYGGQDQFFDDPPPAGSVIRFIARDGAVEVWVRERQSVAASASEIRPSSR